jgi:hypothetical protein
MGDGVVVAVGGTGVEVDVGGIGNGSTTGAGWGEHPINKASKISNASLRFMMLPPCELQTQNRLLHLVGRIAPPHQKPFVVRDMFHGAVKVQV